MRWALLLAALLATQGCATLLAGGSGHLDLEIQDPPPGTIAVLHAVGPNEADRQLAPSARGIELRKPFNYALGITAPGHKPQLVLIKQELSPYYLAELAALPAFAGLGIYGSVVRIDPLTMVGLYGCVGLLAATLVDELTLSFLAYDRQQITTKLEKR